MKIRLVLVPPFDAPLQEILEFAATYNGYERFIDEPRILQEFFESSDREYRNTGRINPYLGLDFLRAWLFLLYRVDHVGGGSDGDFSEPYNLWRSIVERINDLSGGQVVDCSFLKTIDNSERD